MVVHAVLYVGLNFLFLHWDRNGIFKQYKLHRTRVMGPTEALIQKTWREAVGRYLTKRTHILSGR